MRHKIILNAAQVAQVETIRSKLKLSKPQFSKALGLSVSAYANMVAREKVPEYIAMAAQGLMGDGQPTPSIDKNTAYILNLKNGQPDLIPLTGLKVFEFNGERFLLVPASGLVDHDPSPIPAVTNSHKVGISREAQVELNALAREQEKKYTAGRPHTSKRYKNAGSGTRQDKVGLMIIDFLKENGPATRTEVMDTLYPHAAGQGLVRNRANFSAYLTMEVYAENPRLVQTGNGELTA